MLVYQRVMIIAIITIIVIITVIIHMPNIGVHTTYLELLLKTAPTR